ncbi:MAG: hypothetical protein AB7V37_05310, partial [Eubacteriaceae bacterium]
KVRFGGGYNQMNSTVSINKADLVLFSGGSFSFDGDGPSSSSLQLASDRICIDTETINFTQYYNSGTVGFKYNGKNGTAGSLSLKQAVSWDPGGVGSGTVKAGKYESVSGSFPQASGSVWLYELEPAAYTVPTWTALNVTILSPPEPTIPGSGSGSSGSGTVSGGFITNGSEKYY